MLRMNEGLDVANTLPLHSVVAAMRGVVTLASHLQGYFHVAWGFVGLVTRCAESSKQCTIDLHLRLDCALNCGVARKRHASSV